MERVGPFSETTFEVTYGPNAFGRWQNGQPAIGQAGSIPGVETWTHLIEEAVHLIEHSGQMPDRTDLQQVRKAIAAMIAAATGAGDTSRFLLVDQARARLPIFPEILSADGRMNVSSPAAGTVLVPPTVNFQHRGIFPMSTSDYAEASRTFPTLAGKTYHLRWTPQGGFALHDLAAASYNPTSATEADVRFDTTYDDMLVARVVTSGGNIATITNLTNLPTLSTSGEEQSAFGNLGGKAHEDGVSPAQISQFTRATINWSRRPQAFLTALNDVMTAQATTALEFNIGVRPISRYQLAVWGQGDVDIWTGWAARA